MKAPDLHRYLDYRAFLRDWYAAKKAADPKFSKRKFARLAGKRSPGLLTEVVDGKRNPNLPMVRAFCDAMKLSAAESDFFEALVALDQAETTRERNAAWRRISAARAFRDARPVDGAGFRYLSEWYIPAVRELAHRPDFQADPGWIHKRIRPEITPGEAKQALEVLTELELLVDDGDGGLVPADGLVTTPHEVRGLAVHNYHLGMLERAAEAVDRFEPDERHFLGATVSVPHALVPQLKAELNAVQERILELADGFDGDAEEVLQLELMLFPLSDRAGDPEAS